jgi:hypothetical protein
MKNTFLFTLLFSLILLIGERTMAVDLVDGDYTAYPAKSLPKIDGIGDDLCWNDAQWATLNQLWIGSAVNATDYSGRFKVLWTPERLYVLIEIVDDVYRTQPVVADICPKLYEYDCVEVFIDENYSRESLYTGTYNAIAYHLDPFGHVCYYVGSSGWDQLDNHINYKVSETKANTHVWELELKVYDDKFAMGSANTPVTLSSNKLMGWSIAYNDNDAGSTRQNMFGSIFIPGNSDNERNVSYKNASVFGKLSLTSEDATSINTVSNTDPFNSKAYFSNGKIHIELNPENENVSVGLFNIQGKALQRLTVKPKTGRSTSEINVAGLPDGIYLVRINNSKGLIVNKVNILIH